MSLIYTGVTSCKNIAFGALLLLASCGGGGGGESNPSPDPTPSTPPLIGLSSSSTVLAEGSTIGTANPTWKDGSGTGSPIDGITCRINETYHVHAVVSIYWNGTRQALPALIGLVGCTYEIHTHDLSGVVHLEADSQRSVTLGQFFSVWGQPLSNSNVAGITGQAWFYTIDMDNATVTPFTGSDPRTVAITPHAEIAIVIGTPPAALDKDKLPTGF